MTSTTNTAHVSSFDISQFTNNKTETLISTQTKDEGALSSSPQVPVEDAAAWLRVLSGFLIFVMTWGPSSGVGAFESYYQTSLLSDYTAGQIAWIGSVQTSLLLSVGVISGPLFDQGYLRLIMCLGCSMCVLGFMLLSLSTKYYQVVLTQGILFGTGTGFAYVPCMAMVATRFQKNRPVAMGIVSSGSSVGGVIIPIIIRQLEPRIGFPWTVRVIGFMQLAVFIIALSILLREQECKRPPRKIFQPKAFLEPSFAFFSLGLFFQNLSYWLPFAFITSYAMNHLHASADTAFYLLAAANGTSIFGRIVPSIAAQCIGSFHVFMISTAACTALLFSWVACSNVGGFATFCVLFGFFSGVLPSISPICAAMRPVSPSPEVTGTRLGMAWLLGGVGILIGNPIAGALIDIEAGSFMKAQIFAGVIMGAAWLSWMWPYIAHEKLRRAGLKV